MGKLQKNLFSIPARDLDDILRASAADLETLRGARVFLTGGTGFFGKWLLATLLRANEEMDLGAAITVLSRNPALFQEKYPDAETAGLTFLSGNIAHFAARHRHFDFIVHAAADTTAVTSEPDERERTRAIVGGTRKILELAKRCDARLLYISSGAVYGAAAGKKSGAKEEDFATAEAVMPYGEAKREAENLCTEAGVHCVTARAFAFLGPHLPLDAHFAAGNFLRDAIRGGPVLVRGDGTALRSYLYPTDLVIWLLRLLVRGRRGDAYNVGSDEAVSTAQLARLIADAVEPKAEVTIQSTQPQGPQNIYLPNIDKARDELGLPVAVPLREGVARTLDYLKTEPA